MKDAELFDCFHYLISRCSGGGGGGGGGSGGGSCCCGFWCCRSCGCC